MAYSAVIDALLPYHRWTLDGDVLDARGTANGTNSGGLLTVTAVCRDTVNSYLTNGTNDRIVLPTTTDINNSAQTRKAIGIGINTVTDMNTLVFWNNTNFVYVYRKVDDSFDGIIPIYYNGEYK